MHPIPKIGHILQLGTLGSKLATAYRPRAIKHEYFALTSLSSPGRNNQRDVEEGMALLSFRPSPVLGGNKLWRPLDPFDPVWERG
jgi:hypothetical protein